MKIKSIFVFDALTTFHQKMFLRHKELCNRDEFMSALPVHLTPVSKQAQIKFNQHKYCTKAPFLNYADVECILKPFGRQKKKKTTLTQKHKMCAVTAILLLTLFNFNQRTVIKVGNNALSDFLYTLIM